MKLPFLSEAPDLRPDMAAEFCRVWFAGVSGHPYVVSIPQYGQGVLTQSLEDVEDAVESLGSAAGLAGLVYGSGVNYQTYVGMSTRMTPVVDMHRRGGIDEIAWIPGVWADLDNKEGRFAGAEKVEEFVERLEVRPTVVVKTGSGGMHLYWKFRQPVDAGAGATMVRAWWAYLEKQAGSVGGSIDRLIDATRIMKLPGTVRWPGEGEGGMGPALVELVKADGPVYEYADIAAMGRPYHEAYIEGVRETRARLTQHRVRAAEEVVESGVGQWNVYAVIASMEDDIAAEMSWDEILEPYGWVKLRTDGEGRRHWARPGRSVKSATTDWVDSPDVMSLHSDALDTELSDLKEAGVALTKYRVWLRLRWNDDEAAFIRDRLERRGM